MEKTTKQLTRKFVPTRDKDIQHFSSPLVFWEEEADPDRIPLGNGKMRWDSDDGNILTMDDEYFRGIFGFLPPKGSRRLLELTVSVKPFPKKKGKK